MARAALEPRSRAADPRVARSREAILRATADLLIEGGAAAVTIEGVSEKSGVAKTTIYRHWKSRSQLTFDAFRRLLEQDAPRFGQAPRQGGSIQDTLVFMLRRLVWGLTESRWAPTVSALVDAADRDLEMHQLIHDFLVERMAGAKKVIAEAVRRGELAATVDPDVVVDMLTGPIFYRRLVSREPLDGDFVERVVDQVLAGAAPRPA